MIEIDNNIIDWMNTLKYTINFGNKRPSIEGVILKELTTHLDGRGDVIELWSKPWIGEGFVNTQHVYQSATDFGVVKAWHLHKIHTDQITVTRGKLQLSLIDLRKGSASFGNVDIFFLGSSAPRIIKVPPFIMHGWKALSSPEVIVVNMQSHIYMPEDEIRFPWDCVLHEIWEPKNG